VGSCCDGRVHPVARKKPHRERLDVMRPTVARCLNVKRVTGRALGERECEAAHLNERNRGPSRKSIPESSSFHDILKVTGF
jgi:hypothetical protein